MRLGYDNNLLFLFSRVAPAREVFNLKRSAAPFFIVHSYRIKDMMKKLILQQF